MVNVPVQVVKKNLLVIICVLVFGIFFTDILTPRPYSEWFAFVAPLILTVWLPNRRLITLVTAVCVLLIILGFFLSPPGPTEPNRIFGYSEITIINRVTSILTIMLTGYLLTLRKNAVEKLRRAHDELENRVQERTQELTIANTGLASEIVERKKTEDKLAEYSRTLEKRVADRTKKLIESEKLKSEFLADASHELRTPIAVIKSRIDLTMKQKPQNFSEIRESLQEIDDEVLRISQIVGDLALLTKNGPSVSRAFIYKKIHLKELISKVVQRHETLAKNKNIDIATSIEPIILKGDTEKLDNLFSNLIANAINYGKNQGWIRLTGTKKGDAYIVDVVDNGIGIPSSAITHIFERFYRVEKARSRDLGGVGLGLSIAQLIAKAHGGNITCKSSITKGTTFSVRFPLL